MINVGDSLYFGSRLYVQSYSCKEITNVIRSLFGFQIYMNIWPDIIIHLAAAEKFRQFSVICIYLLFTLVHIFAFASVPSGC